MHWAVPANQTSQPRAWMKNHPSSIAATGVHVACPFYFRLMDKIESIFPVMCPAISFSVSLTVLNAFLLTVCLSVRDYRWWEEGKERRWQISGRPSSGSVCLPSENGIHLCHPDAYARLFASLFVCVCCSVEERIGRWGWWWGGLFGGGGFRWGLAHIRQAAFVPASKRTAVAW